MQRACRDFGALFDQYMTMDEQIDSVCRAAHFHLRGPCRVRPFLDHAANKQLVHALIISRLDCYNCLLYGLPAERLRKLQKVQDALCYVRLYAGLQLGTT